VKAQITAIAICILCAVLWFLRVQAYDVLELRQVIEPALYQQALPLILFAVSLSSIFMAKLRASKAQPTKHAHLEDKVTANSIDPKELADIKESLADIHEKVTDLHAMATLRHKKHGENQ